MKKVISRGKGNARAIRSALGEERMLEITAGVMAEGKAVLDDAVREMGQLLVESILYMQREEIAGPDYFPSEGFVKGGTQQGSVYVGQEKMHVRCPRLRHEESGEVRLPAYSAMRRRGAFSEELLTRSLSGMAGRRYKETIGGVAEAFGVSKSSVSRHIVEATAEKLAIFKERRLDETKLFALFIDTIHRGGAAFVVALAIDILGKKTPLGFWEGATENSDICSELFRDLKGRGLVIPETTIFVTDGGSGVCKFLHDLLGDKLIHQRCTIHKTRNIQRHLAKKYRKEADNWFRKAMNHLRYEDAEGELKELHNWLLSINGSAAASLKEAWNELLTLHRLGVPDLLRVSLHSTNPLESMFGTVRETELNIKRFRSTEMRQRWFATVLLDAEKGFNRVRGYMHIKEVVDTIERLQVRKAA